MSDEFFEDRIAELRASGEHEQADAAQRELDERRARSARLRGISADPDRVEAQPDQVADSGRRFGHAVGTGAAVGCMRLLALGALAMVLASWLAATAVA